MTVVERLPLNPGRFAVTESERWVRGVVDDVVVVDSRAQQLVWTPDEAVPRYAFSPTDVRMDALTASVNAPRRRTFFEPSGDMADFFDLRVKGRLFPNAAWSWRDPDLRDLVSVSWRPDLLDRWSEEDETVVLHPRDPFKRIDALPSSRHVVVSLDGVTLADSTDPVLLFETRLPTRYYLPVEDVALSRLRPLSTTTVCPYKGTADRSWTVAGRPDHAVLAWSYNRPRPAVPLIAGRIAFYNEFVDLVVDGVPLQRARSEFSDRRST